MFKLLIADDDFLVRTYLKSLDSWERAGYQVAADVRDGEEALKVLDEMNIDVLITDISMPLMNGIQLIQKVRECNQKIYIIVLSCYDDFEYVKEAMRFGANEYILKNTLDEKFLYELLMNSRHHILEQQKKESTEAHSRKLLKMGSQSLKFQFFNQLLSGKMLEGDREEQKNQAGIQGKYFNSAVIAMFVKNWNELCEQWGRMEAEQYSRNFLNTLTDAMDEEYLEIIYLGTGVFCCFLDMSSIHRSSMMRQRLTNVAAVCLRCCKNEIYEFGIGVSNVCMGADGVRQAYLQAREMMRQSFYAEEVILYYDSQKPMSMELPVSAKEMENQISLLREGWMEKEMIAAMDMVLTEFEKEHTDSRSIVQWLKEIDQQLEIQRPGEFYHNISRFSQVQTICRDYGKIVTEDREKEFPEGTGMAVRMAVQFIREHFRESIGLTDVAEAAAVNATYLSYLFKQEMGIGFSNYLLQCRINFAKELLETTNHKIKEIAEASGFNDYHHFSKAFKKTTGSSPADYRKTNI